MIPLALFGILGLAAVVLVHELAEIVVIGMVECDLALGSLGDRGCGVDQVADPRLADVKAKLVSGDKGVKRATVADIDSDRSVIVGFDDLIEGEAEGWHALKPDPAATPVASLNVCGD